MNYFKYMMTFIVINSYAKPYLSPYSLRYPTLGISKKIKYFRILKPLKLINLRIIIGVS